MLKKTKVITGGMDCIIRGAYLRPTSYAINCWIDNFSLLLPVLIGLGSAALAELLPRHNPPPPHAFYGPGTGIEWITLMHVNMHFLMVSVPFNGTLLMPFVQWTHQGHMAKMLSLLMSSLAFMSTFKKEWYQSLVLHKCVHRWHHSWLSPLMGLGEGGGLAGGRGGDEMSAVYVSL